MMTGKSEFSKEELERYARQFVLKDFGYENQLKLKKSSVLVIGAGGLGAPLLLYLTAAGIGKLGIVDFDSVQLSNLQRQVLFDTQDLGMNKANAAVQHLAALNPETRLHSYAEKLTSLNVSAIIDDYDIVVDCSDNFPTRYLANDACILRDKPLVYGAILQFEGQLSVFNVKENQKFSTNYRDLFPQPPPPESIPNCEEVGVLGVLPGFIGTLMATEVIKLITRVSSPLTDQLLIVDALSLEFTKIKIPDRSTRNEVTRLIDYEDFCGVSVKKSKYLGMKECTVQELQRLIEENEDHQLIDVREPHEYDICNIGGELIPMAQVPHSLEKISKEKKVIVHCRTGGRSRQIIMWLEKNHGFDNLYNLQGGITEWANSIDPSLDVY